MKLRPPSLAAALVLLAPPLAAQPPAPLQQRVEAKLAEAGPGPRFGLVVATDDGRELVAVNPEGRFMPASTTKIFTTAAAYATLGALDGPDAAGGASVRLEPFARGAPDVVLEGHGDARLSSAADCAIDCLAVLADAIAAKTREVARVIGDDRFYPDERWSPGMSWNNIPTRSGTAASALTLDDNEIELVVSPAAAGQPPRVDQLGYYAVDNRAVTVPAGGKTDLSYDRLPGEMAVRLTGTIAAGAAAERLRLGIDEPARYAAWRLRALLAARGVKVNGPIEARHRPVITSSAPASAAAVEVPPLARLTPPPLAQDVTTINKASQNLHAELLLRRIGRRQGTGSLAEGLAQVRATLAAAGLARTQYDFSDGSGMSTYNRIAPRGAVTLLRWIARQPWGAQWRSTLPIAGVDGTLRNRFRGSTLERRLFAKTGTINATNALSGYMLARSGRMLVFAAYANDVPEGAAAARAIDAALELVAQEN